MKAAIPNSKFPEYMKKHHRAWYDWARKKGHVVKPEQLILVRGVLTASEWTAAVFQSTSGSPSAGIQGTFVPTRSAGFELSNDTRNDGSVEFRSVPSGGASSASSREYDQCVFVPHYRIKYAPGVWQRITAAAGDWELPNAEDDASQTRVAAEAGGHVDCEPNSSAHSVSAHLY